jgi:hypothetical protein
MGVDAIGVQTLRRNSLDDFGICRLLEMNLGMEQVMGTLNEDADAKNVF